MLRLASFAIRSLHLVPLADTLCLSDPPPLRVVLGPHGKPATAATGTLKFSNFFVTG